MSVYFTHQVNSPSVEEGQLNHVDLSWHPSYSILAVVAQHNTNGIVFFCYDEGELMEEVHIEKSVHVEGICWHPDKKLLAIGWKNGDITICNVHTAQFYDQSIHRSSVNILQWTNTSTHLLSADVNGLIVMWRLEPTGELYPTPIQQVKLTGEITHCILLHDASKVLQMKFKTSDAVICIFALKTGQLYLWNSGNKCTELENLHSTVTQLIHSPQDSLLAALTKNMLLVLMSTQKDSLQKISEVKLGSYGTINSMIWTLPGVLATCSNEPFIRFWDTANNDNYTISLSDYMSFSDDDPEIVTALSYNNKTGFLSAGTKKGLTFLWNRRDNQWHIITYFTSDQPVNYLAWDSTKHLLAISHDQSVQIISEHILAYHYDQEISAIQISAKKALIQYHPTNSIITLLTDIIINGIVIGKSHVAVWNGSMVCVYTISFNKNLVNKTGSFKSQARSVAVYEYSVFTVEEDHLFVRSAAGVIKHKLPLGVTSEHVQLRLMDHYLVLAVSNGSIKMFDLSRREPKLVCSRSVAHAVDNFMSIISAQPNCNGSRISFLAKKASNQKVLGILNYDKDVIKVLDLQKQSDNSLKVPDGLPDGLDKDQSKLISQLEGVDIIRTYWDGTDPKLLTIEVIKRYMSSQEQHMSSVVTCFVTTDMSYLMQDMSPISPYHHSLIGCTAPFMYFLKKNPSPPSFKTGEVGEVKFAVERSPLKDFIGFEDSDPTSVKAMLSFSYNSTIGNMDEAFKSIKTIKNQNVWKTLATMCVKTRRLDVALVCLGHMGNARVARAVREAKLIPEEDAQLAVLAVHLGMLDVAEELYKSSGRYDLLNLFYQACGKWQKSIEVAETNDRIHLKNTYYNLAKYSEGVGEIKAAIKSYEQSETNQFEVVRMLINDPDELLDYTVKCQDKSVQHYWAEHLECTGELDAAIQQYQSCDDIQSTVRLLIYTGEEDKAIKIVSETGNKAAAYHVAKVFAQSEELSRIKKAIQLYTMAQCYTHAITVAQEYGLEAELMNLALLSTREDKIEVARYFETNSDSKEKAIILYHKAGELSKALDLCFQYYQYDILQQISEELTAASNPETIRKVAEYFIEQEQFDKAVKILLQSQKMSEALEMCLKHSVTITEELAEKLTPTKPENETPEQTEQRLQTLDALADGLASQGSYHLAAMKYTLAGNKIKGMKALLKSGDTERIMFFANVSRQKEIYIMAANYLQSLNWRGNPDVMKNIIGFYMRGRALETLANFYDTCAKVEIEEYQNYDKAQGALNEALTVLGKAKSDNPSALEEKKQFLKKRLELIKKFSDIRNGYADSPEQSIKQCEELLEDPNAAIGLRIGDVYAMLVTHYTVNGDCQKAYSYIEEMKKHIPGVNIKFYIKTQTLEAISKAISTPSPLVIAQDADESDDSIEEVVD